MLNHDEENTKAILICELPLVAVTIYIAYLLATLKP